VNNIKLGWCGLDWSGTVESSCEHSNELLGFIKLPFGSRSCCISSGVQPQNYFVDYKNHVVME
jgi:hypothetical protein